MRFFLILDRKDIPSIKNKLMKLLPRLNGNRISILTNHEDLKSVVGSDLQCANIYHVKRFRGKYFLAGDILLISRKSIIRYLKETDYVYSRVLLFSGNGKLPKPRKIRRKMVKIEDVERVLNRDFVIRDG